MAQEGCARVGCVCDLSVTEMPSLLRTLAAVGRVDLTRDSESPRARRPALAFVGECECVSAGARERVADREGETVEVAIRNLK